MAANGKSIAEGGEFMYYCLISAQKLNSSALLNGGTSAPLLAIYCWQQLILQKCSLQKSNKERKHFTNLEVGCFMQRLGTTMMSWCVPQL